MYLIEERETVIRTDELMDGWIVDSTQRAICNRVRKLRGVRIIAEETTSKGTVIAGRYILPMKSISFRNLRELSTKTRKDLKRRARENLHDKEE
jgi:hypothetical protein